MERKYFKYSEASDKIRREILDRISMHWDAGSDDYQRAGEIIEEWLDEGEISADGEIRKYFDEVELYWEGDGSTSFEGVCKDIPQLLRAAGATSAWNSLRKGCRRFDLEMPAKWAAVDLMVVVDGFDCFSSKPTLGSDYDLAIKKELSCIREFSMGLSKRLAEEIRAANDELIRADFDETAERLAEYLDGEILYRRGEGGEILVSGYIYNDFDYALALAEIEEQAILDFVPEGAARARRLLV